MFSSVRIKAITEAKFSKVVLLVVVVVVVVVVLGLGLSGNMVGDKILAREILCTSSGCNCSSEYCDTTKGCD